MSKPTVSAAGGALLAEGRQLVAALDPDLRQSMRRTLEQMVVLLGDGTAPALDEIAGREPLLAVADMLDEINALIDAKHYDAAEAKLAEAKALLATVKIDEGAQ
jgi:hypothetical protein